MARALVVDPDATMAARFARALELAGHLTTLVGDGRAALECLDSDHFDLMFVELELPGQSGIDVLKEAQTRAPDLPVVIVAAEPAVTEAVGAMRAGASDFVLKPSSDEEIAYVVSKALASRASKPPFLSASGKGLLGESDSMQQVRTALGKAASGDATVLIRGESGTGKELVAQALHEQSARRAGPLVKIDCGSLPDTLLESELFGYEKGAFTGATARKPGRIDLAASGTVFLDEIGEVSPAMQVKLLRLLQDRAFERLGGRQTHQIDVRFVLATHRDLEAMVQNGSFRQDLFYRINVLPLWLPPLRSRRGDIPLLANEFCARFAALNGRERLVLTPGAIRLLRAQRWPGNVRQLENFVERLVVFSDGPTIDEQAVERELIQRPRFVTQSADTGLVGAPIPTPSAPAMSDAVRVAERSALEAALKHCGGDRAVAARVLGISRSTLYSKVKEYGIGRSKTSS
jgi:two-component system, NtrC family, response regulator AtoC